jgi:hypothetical protein
MSRYVTDFVSRICLICRCQAEQHHHLPVHSFTENMAADSESVPVPSFHVTTHYTAASFLDAVGSWLREDEEQAALIIAASKASSPNPVITSVAAEANNL